MDSKDLVQETVLKTLQAFHKIQHKERLLSFMIGVASNIVKNKLRRKKFSAVWNEHAMQQLECKTPSPEVSLEIHCLYKALQQLPALQKEAIILFEISGFSIAEISEMQKSTIGATKTRLSRGRQRLKNLMSEQNRRVSMVYALPFLFSILASQV